MNTPNLATIGLARLLGLRRRLRGYQTGQPSVSQPTFIEEAVQALNASNQQELEVNMNVIFLYIAGSCTITSHAEGHTASVDCLYTAHLSHLIHVGDEH